MSKHTAGSANQSSFARVSSMAPQRSVVPISTTRSHTGDAGYLIPALHIYTLPGDVFNFQLAVFSRLLTLKFPLMDNLILEWFAFFVPERIIWDNFERFQGFQPDPDSSTDFVLPYVRDLEETNYQFPEGGVGDYLGMPILVDIDASVWHVRAGAFRAYRTIWNEWFRDQSYQDTLPVSGDPLNPRGDGPDPVGIVDTLLRRNKRPDYFSMALPNPQKGPEVPLPWANEGRAPVWGVEGEFIQFSTVDDNTGFYMVKNTGAGSSVTAFPGTATDQQIGLLPDDNTSSGIYADVQAVSASLNALRESIVLQQIYELDARGGTRYSESLMMRWNVDAGDARLQRPEYISAGSSSFNVSQVAQTSPTSGENAQASLAAYAELSAIGNVSYTCVEHGHILVLMNVRAPLTYQQGLNRQHLAASRFDLPEPLTMNLGERAVMSHEIYFPPTDPANVWGYQPIWSEYLYMPSFVTGKFRSNVPDSLDSWHLALDYDSPPDHNGLWLEDNPPVDRVIQFTGQPQFKFNILAKGKVARAMPANPIPGLLRF